MSFLKHYSEPYLRFFSNKLMSKGSLKDQLYEDLITNETRLMKILETTVHLKGRYRINTLD